MGRLKKLKKIRIHREGTHILWGSFFLLLIINLALYWGIDCKIPFYLVALVSIVVDDDTYQSHQIEWYFTINSPVKSQIYDQ